MIRPDDSINRIPPQAYKPNPTTPGVGKSPGAEPAAAAGASTPAPAVEPVVDASPTNTINVRELGGQDPLPFDPEQGLTFPGGRHVGGTEKPRFELVSSLMDADIDAPDFNDLGPSTGDAVFYWKAAYDAFQSGATEMGKDLLAWAREFDPGAPDIPPQGQAAIG